MAVGAVFYDGSIFYSRWSRDRDLERTETRREVEQAQSPVAILGGDELRILNFCASPGVIRFSGFRLKRVR
jgi:hypothetical protein